MASNNRSSDCSTSTAETSSTKKDEVLIETLTCGICLSRMTSPCCLHCGHGFCRQCLLDYASSQMNTSSSNLINSLLCPYCKYQVEFHSIEHLESILIMDSHDKTLNFRMNLSGGNDERKSSTWIAYFQGRKIFLNKTHRHFNFRDDHFCRVDRNQLTNNVLILQIDLFSNGCLCFLR